MTKTLSFVAAAMLCAIATQSFGQNEGFQPVTNDVLANPPPGDWLMINRTYDEQRFSPLDQINKSNAGQLQMAWSRACRLAPMKQRRSSIRVSCTPSIPVAASLRSTPPTAT